VDKATQPNQPIQKKQSAGLALSLAFVPSVLMLVFFAVGQFGLWSDVPEAVFWVPCIVAVVCRFASSFMLFAGKSRAAIAAGVIFLLLNASVSFVFGCYAL